MTRDQALTRLETMIENIKEEGPQDVAAWEYRAELQQAYGEICNGGDVQDIMESIL